MTAYANVGDYFYINKVLANWLVGHVGSSDWNHVYWPLLYQIAMSKNEDTATTLFQTATDMIEKDGSASVDTFLIDGGAALFAATKNIRSSKNIDINVVGVPRRRCFSHNIRMGMTRGGGKRGGKGSLPRYLLDQGVPAKLMSSMLALLILFNCIPNGVVFAHAMALFIHEFNDHINEHVRENYLDPHEPRKLGGRAAGMQGTVGSTNGLERRNRSWKDNTHGIIASKHNADKNNFVHVMAGELN